MSQNQHRMSEERRAEIALVLVRARLVEGGIPSRRRLMQDLDDASKATGISKDELIELYESFIPAILQKTFNFKKVQVIAE